MMHSMIEREKYTGGMVIMAHQSSGGRLRLLKLCSLWQTMQRSHRQAMRQREHLDWRRKFVLRRRSCKNQRRRRGFHKVPLSFSMNG
ncbi:hypothetical protein QTG54_004720 [Skeletonema marinoi]|uniref:Uncharacterized protein n=1 Tax=Skeletonema marinoi TaxID=267567 RepID=A0AAD8YEY1_9STRA|nr:hypothetical protein QTG54_004720 [Skeletonema marinoi]